MYWVIKDTGKRGSRAGPYFCGWKKELDQDSTEAWQHDREKAKEFMTKKEAFAELRTFKAKKWIYAKRTESLRFTVFRVNLPSRRVREELARKAQES